MADGVLLMLLEGANAPQNTFCDYKKTQLGLKRISDDQ
jgi:hypothetical protein